MFVTTAVALRSLVLIVISLTSCYTYRHLTFTRSLFTCSTTSSSSSSVIDPTPPIQRCSGRHHHHHHHDYDRCNGRELLLGSIPISASRIDERSLSASRSMVDFLRAGISLCCCAIGCPYDVNAIGSIDELSRQSMVLQDVSFNVPDNKDDIASLQALFQDKLRRIREVRTSDQRVLTVIGFGADAYNSPSSFIPGVSDFQEDGAHCTITLRDKVRSGGDDEIELFERGTGLEFLKVGVETLRLSKGIENGANIKYAYGWVDLDTPNGIPFNVVVGIARDPLMLAGIRVANIDKSVDFFTNKLGMQVSPFPLARQEGSNFEQPPPPGSVYVSYRGVGESAAKAGMGILLIPTKGVVNVGTQLDAFTIVVDDKDPGLPTFIQTLLKNRVDSSASSPDATTVETRSPDGYRFVLKPYSLFASEATASIVTLSE